MMPAPAICTAADAVGHEIDLSFGESQRDMVFYAAASGVAHGKKKPASQKTPASMICSAAHAVGYEIDLSCGESRRDMVFYAAANGVAHGKKIAGIPKDTGIYDLYRSPCCRVRN